MFALIAAVSEILILLKNAFMFIPLICRTKHFSAGLLILGGFPLTSGAGMKTSH